jgi:hypothetical protein
LRFCRVTAARDTRKQGDGGDGEVARAGPHSNGFRTASPTRSKPVRPRRS